MLVTLEFYDIKLANHSLDNSAIYISELDVNSIAIKRGLAIDTASVKISKDVLDLLSLQPLYLFQTTLVKLYFYDDNSSSFILGLDGVVSKVTYANNSEVVLNIESSINQLLSNSFMPSINNSCQANLYSTVCGLNKDTYKVSLSNILMDCLVGSIPITQPMLDKYPNIDDLYLGIVIINNFYRSRVIGIDKTLNKLYLLSNFYDSITLLASVEIYPYCNKTYGMCYNRFNNTKNFYGFPSTGQTTNTFNIFSSSSITYCGEELQESIVSCELDNSLFGITI